MEIQLPAVRDQRHEFFENTGFVRSDNELFIRPTPPPAK